MTTGLKKHEQAADASQVQPPVGFWDPLGLSVSGNVSATRLPKVSWVSSLGGHWALRLRS